MVVTILVSIVSTMNTKHKVWLKKKPVNEGTDEQADKGVHGQK